MKQLFGDDFYGIWILGSGSGGGMGLFLNPNLLLDDSEAQIKRGQTRQKTIRHIQKLLIECKQELNDNISFAIDPIVYEVAVNNSGTVVNIDDDCQNKDNKQIPVDKNQLPYPQAFEDFNRGIDAILNGEVMLLTLASRVSSKWTFGSENKSKPTSHFMKIKDKFRSFLEVQTSKLKWIENKVFSEDQNQINKIRHIPHVISTSYRTQNQVQREIERIFKNDDNAKLQPSQESQSFINTSISHSNNVFVSNSCWATLRLIPTKVDYIAHFSRYKHLFEPITSPQPQLLLQKSLEQTFTNINQPITYSTQTNTLIDDNKSNQLYHGINQFLSIHPNLPSFEARQLSSSLDWIQDHGEGTNYRCNSVGQCMQPLGHIYDIMSLIKNGTLSNILNDNKESKSMIKNEKRSVHTILMCPVDNIGVWMDPCLLGMHLRLRRAITFEVMERSVDEHGCLLSRIQQRLDDNNDGHLCLVGEHLLREEERWGLRYIGTGAAWIDVDKFLEIVGIRRDDLIEQSNININDKLDYFLHKLPTRVSIREVRRVKDELGGEESHVTA
ncbi:MAG: putative UTP--glucose-1-phosphate uridylyltransferase, partial [Streblomastix strix]